MKNFPNPTPYRVLEKTKIQSTRRYIFLSKTELPNALTVAQFLKKIMNKNFIKIALYIILVVAISFGVHFSKNYFQKNYHKHQTLESKVDLYKVAAEAEEQEQSLREPKIVEQNPVAVLDEQTQVISDSTAIPVDADNEGVKDIEAEEAAAQADTKPIAKKEPQAKDNVQTKVKEQKKPEVQKGVKVVEEKKPNNGEITKPKTLERDPSISKSILKNPVFQSYVVQTGAFKEEKDAATHVAKVKSSSASASYMVKYEKVSSGLYKVFVGYFETDEAARKVCNQLKQDNIQCFTTQL